MKLTPPRIQDDHEKLRELTLYIALKSQEDPNFGKIKLNKLLFFADFAAYVAHGRPITGTTYEVWECGPCVRGFYDLIGEFQKDGSGAMQVVQYFMYPQHRLVALRQPKLDGFRAEEIALVDRVIEAFRNKTGAEMTELSHGLHVWKAFSVGDTIPYTAAFVSNRELTQSEKDYALELERTPSSECA
jgi:uncharacterized phage-associated protein